MAKNLLQHHPMHHPGLLGEGRGVSPPVLLAAGGLTPRRSPLFEQGVFGDIPDLK
jgi:hypothetical protein